MNHLRCKCDVVFNNERLMEKKYLELKAMALDRMAEDFRWIMNWEAKEDLGSNEAGVPPDNPISKARRLRWTAELSLLVEFVYDVNAHIRLVDDLSHRIPLYRLYDSFSRAVGISAPKHPAVSLNKLRAKETRQDISPDTIIRFYMKQIEKELAATLAAGDKADIDATSGASPNRDIILCLLRME